MTFHQKPVTYVGEVQLRVSDLNQSTRFYTEVLGLKIKEQTSNSVSFTTNGQDVLLTITQPNNINKKQEQRTGLYHFALLLPKRADLAQVVRHFINLGVRLGGGDHLVSEAIYLNDPDGNGIEIYVDRDASVWQWSNGEVKMTTDPVDFDDLLKESVNPVWNGLPKGTVMGHIHLQVNDLEKNKQFYVDGLGFDVVSRYGREALFLSDSNYHHHIALNTWSGTQIKHAEKTETGIESYTILFPSETIRDEKLMSLRKIGASIYEENNTFYTIDPSQIKVYLRIS
ncbi:VOC family protein [Vagococcus bubulae]|uniref:Glyoxalase n=1 Tax=Vagococcus bubulae TaxID=1977868 RepID=A0A429ZRA3_9ENTE|nr:VOC family protein [Vagococcus bubulae]RST96179.1 glyoxalase [Vagococcus bubulae]